MSGISILKNLLLKQAVKESGQASGIMSIGDSVRKLAERRLQSYLVSAANKGIDLDKFSESQIKYMLEMNNPYNRAKMQLRKEQGIKSADVFDLKSRKLDKDKPIIGGTQDDLDKKADGGRIGYKDGPKFNFAATGSKSGKQQIEKAPAGITRDQETFQAIMNADIPLNDKLNFLANLQYGKDRVRIDADDQELTLFEGGFKDREFGLGYNEGEEGLSGRVMYNIDTNEPEFKIGFSKKFADGGRVGLKDGMDRRTFLKIMGGLASIPILGKFFKGAKVAKGTKVASDVASTVSKSTPPPYFFELANKIKSLGKPDKVTYADRVEIHRYTGKNGDEYELIEDLSTGDIKITKDKIGGVRVGDDEVVDGIADRSVLEYKKGDVNVDPDAKTASKVPDEYDEYKVEFDVDGTEAEADDMSEFIRKEIIEEANQQAPKIKKAGGGIARVGYFLGSPRQAGTALIREILKYFNRDQKISVSEMLRTFNTRELRKLLDELSTYKKFDVKESGMPMPQILEDRIKKLNVGKEKVLESVLSAANAARKLDADLALRQNEMIEAAVKQGFDRQEAKELVEGMTTAIEKSAGGPPRFKTATDEGIMDIEMMLKDLKTQGDGRKLNSSGGVAGMLGE